MLSFKSDDRYEGVDILQSQYGKQIDLFSRMTDFKL